MVLLVNCLKVSYTISAAPERIALYGALRVIRVLRCRHVFLVRQVHFRGVFRVVVGVLVGHALADGEVSDAVDLVLGGVPGIAMLCHHSLSAGSATTVVGSGPDHWTLA